MRGNAFRHWLPAAMIWAIAWTAAAPTPASAGGLAAIDAYQVGRHHLANGQHEQALAAFNDALRMNPQFVQAYVARGKLLAEMGQFTSALADLNFALHLQPTHVEGFAYRAFALLSLSRPDEALADLDTALRLDPKYARVHYLRSQTLRGLGKETEAEVSLATALQLDPTIEARQVVVANHDGVASDGRIELASPTVPERTSVMARNEPVEPMDKRKMGNVVRYERHPFLAKLERPAISQPRQPMGFVQDGQPQVIDRPAAQVPAATKSNAPAELPKGNDPSLQLPSPDKTASKADAATTPLIIPQLEELPKTSDAKYPETSDNDENKKFETAVQTKGDEPKTADVAAESKKDDAVAESKPVFTPLPSIELPLLAKEPAAEPTLPKEALPLPVQEPAIELPTLAEAPAATLQAPVMETTPSPMATPSSIAPPDVVVEQPINASAILAEPAVADRPSTERRAAAESERLAAALDAARQASLDRTAIVMSTQATPGGPIDMPVITDMPTESEMPAAAETTAEPLPVPVEMAPPAVPVVSPVVADNAVAMVSDAPDVGELVAPPVHGGDEEAKLDVEAKIALKQLNEVIRQNPGDVAARAQRGQLHLSGNQLEVAVADFDEVLKLEPMHAEARFGRAHALYLAGQYTDAAYDFTAVLAADDQHAAALIERGHCYAMLGKSVDADRDRNAALALDPSLAKTGPKYGGSFAAIAESDSENTGTNSAAPTSAFGNLFNPANTGNQNAAAPKPESNAVFVSDAERPMKSEVVPAYAGDEVTPQAEIMATSAELLKTPGNAMLYVRRAQAWMAVGRHLDAVDDLTAALHIDAECNVALNLRSKAYAALGRTAEAQTDQARADQLSVPR